MRLLASGLLVSYHHRGTDRVRDTGGAWVTEASQQAVDAAGIPTSGLHVLGIPTEHVRWFTQVGSGRPGPWGRFTMDADTVARLCLEGVGRLMEKTAGRESVQAP